MKIPLQEWVSDQVIADEMLWKGAFGHQIEFLWTLARLVATGQSESADSLATVISTHRSKSIELPVVSLERPDLGLRFVVRHNFYNWKLSVLDDWGAIGLVNFDGLFHTSPPVEPEYTGNPLASCYFEGFPEDLIFDYYDNTAPDRRRWSAEIWGDNKLWTVMFLLMRSAGAIKAHHWHTRKSHRAALDIESAKWKADREKAGGT